MTRIAYGEFCTLIADLADDRSTTDIIAEIRAKHGDKLNDLTAFIVDNAVTNILKNLRRRTATRRVAGGQDLFAGHSVPAITTKEELNEHGKRVRVNVHTENLTKQELRDKISSLAIQPARKNKKLRDYESLLEDIDAHCGDHETVEVGLRRARKLP